MKKTIYEVKVGKAVKEAAKLIKEGKVIIYPTETSYAIGADATNVEAVEKVREIKNRPAEKPISVVVDSLKTMKWYAELDFSSMRLADAFMPGPLTLVVKKKPTLPKDLSGDTVAFRVSRHPFTQQLCSEAGLPITATSANISGEEAIFEVNTEEEIIGKVDAVFDSGKLPETLPSTIYNAVERKVIREGVISKEIIEIILED